jgi:hypothetical protein
MDAKKDQSTPVDFPYGLISPAAEKKNGQRRDESDTGQAKLAAHTKDNCSDLGQNQCKEQNKEDS